MEKGIRNIINAAYYQTNSIEIWNGRIDGEDNSQLRWHQTIETINLNEHFILKRKDDSKNQHLVFLGFKCDEGVRRNQGRTGAALAPDEIRKACANFPIHSKINLYDAGDIVCTNKNLEEAQKQLAIATKQILSTGGFPILIGGGHEITFGHYSGIQQEFSDREIGIINLDAHFDNRKPNKGGINSGTGFYQIEQAKKSNNSELHYLAVGIQKSENTQELFKRAEKTNSIFILDKDINFINIEIVNEIIKNFCAKVESIYLTIDMDVFSSSFAPGVSASNAKGIAPDYLLETLLDMIFTTKKVVSVDIAEVNPLFDLDSRTAKLAARLIFDIVERL